MKELYLKAIADRLQVRVWQVENCIELFADGATIPFVSRYRKEKTGGLDEVEVASIKHYAGIYEDLEKRKETVLENIGAAGALTEQLKRSVEDCLDPNVLEDIYLPYRPKRRTRATVAREAGLEPLADRLWKISMRDPVSEASKFVGDKVHDAEAALAGARDIVAERLSETAAIREAMRAIFLTRSLVCKETKNAGDPAQAAKYRSYFNFRMPLQRIASHQFLAVMRASEEGFLSMKIDADTQACCKKIYYEFSKGKPYPADAVRQQLNLAVEDSFKRLIEPSVSGEVLKICKQKADMEAVRIFGENLRQLLLSDPAGQKRTMAIDPGFRTGCKVVCLDEQGNLLHFEAIFPHPPISQKVKAIQAISRMIEAYRPELIAVGSGTAGRETVDFLGKIPMPYPIKIHSVSEDGASVYSASEVAREEFPDHDVTVRGAVSIGRRLMDPLSELVKIDPKSLGIGQYQHDVDQAMLKEKLDVTVESCVNTVGVNVNTASRYLLSYVSGIGPALAANIVDYRTQVGPFSSREELKKVKRMGDKAFEQCAGFLRIKGGENALDNSAVHPESYPVVYRMASDLGVDYAALISNQELCDRIQIAGYVTEGVGEVTVRQIVDFLRKPSLDPREQAGEFSFAPDVHGIDDLHPGMELPGIVTNLTAFGAFVDVGVHDNGLIHVSQMGVRGLDNPSKVLHLHQKIRARVISVDVERGRISLALVSGKA